MNVNKIIKIIIFIIIIIVFSSIGFTMISAPNTMENVIGSIILLAIVIITIKTIFNNINN